jgi:hypothetical protein
MRLVHGLFSERQNSKKVPISCGFLAWWPHPSLGLHTQLRDIPPACRHPGVVKRRAASAPMLHAAALASALAAKGLSCSSNRITCDALHSPPRTAGIPRSCRPAARARSDSQPAASAIVRGACLAALRTIVGATVTVPAGRGRLPLCPQPVGADIRPKGVDSRFDPKRR